MSVRTIITWADPCPDPDPWMIDTLSSLGASTRMIRLYSGTYLSVSGLARAMPLSISGTKSRGLLTNFFTVLPPGISQESGLSHALRPLIGERFQNHGDGDGPRVQGADAPLAGVTGPPPHGLHRPRRLGPLPPAPGRPPQRAARLVAGADALLDDVDRGHQRVKQRLVAHVRPAASLGPLYRRPQHLAALDRLQLDRGPGGRPRAQERRPPDRARRAADPAGDDHGDLLEEGSDVSAVEVVPARQHKLESARHRVAEV